MSLTYVIMKWSQRKPVKYVKEWTGCYLTECIRNRAQRSLCKWSRLLTLRFEVVWLARSGTNNNVFREIVMQSIASDGNLQIDYQGLYFQVDQHSKLLHCIYHRCSATNAPLTNESEAGTREWSFLVILVCLQWWNHKFFLREANNYNKILIKFNNYY